MCTSGLLLFPSYQLALLAAVIINVACLLWYREADPFYNHATNDLQFVCNLFGESSTVARLPPFDRTYALIFPF